MIIHNIKQGTTEWQKVRLGKLTASNAQAIAVQGKGLETLIYKTIAEILTGKQEQGYYNADMERGNTLEAVARALYEIKTGQRVDTVGFCELDEYSGASPDGLIGDDGLIEIKCKSDNVFVQELLSDSIDSGHKWQMQMQMFVTGRKWCDYVVYNPNFPNPIKITRVYRDEHDIEKIKSGIEFGKRTIIDLLKKINESNTTQG
jgi:putative phage-type endonuclease